MTATRERSNYSLAAFVQSSRADNEELISVCFNRSKSVKFYQEREICQRPGSSHWRKTRRVGASKSMLHSGFFQHRVEKGWMNPPWVVGANKHVDQRLRWRLPKILRAALTRWYILAEHRTPGRIVEHVKQLDVFQKCQNQPRWFWLPNLHSEVVWRCNAILQYDNVVCVVKATDGDTFATIKSITVTKNT